MFAWIDTKGNIHRLVGYCKHRGYAMKILNEKGIQCEHSKSTEVLVDMGWVCVCANGFQFSRINADQIFSLREYIERQDVVFIEAPRWPKRLSPKEFLERLS